jgi:hypothetical protein
MPLTRRNPRVLRGLGRADDGTRTHDLLHGKQPGRSPGSLWFRRNTARAGISLPVGASSRNPFAPVWTPNACKPLAENAAASRAASSPRARQWRYRCVVLRSAWPSHSCNSRPDSAAFRCDRAERVPELVPGQPLTFACFTPGRTGDGERSRRSARHARPRRRSRRGR